MLTRYGRGSIEWVDLVAPTREEVRALMKEYAIDPTIAEELLLPSFKSKVERRGEALYVILHFPTLPGMNSRPEQEIDFVIGKNFLITAHYENIDPLHAFSKAFEVEGVLGRHKEHTHGGHLFASMLKNLYQALVGECDAIAEHLRSVEEQIFGGAEKRMVVELSHVGRIIHDFRQALIPHREMLHSLEVPAARFFGPEYGHHLRSAEAAYARIEHELMNLRESLQELRETNNALVSTKQNEIMQTLTILTFIFLPLSFIAGLFGMNIEPGSFAESPYAFLLIVGGMVVLAGAFFIIFRRKGWL